MTTIPLVQVDAEDAPVACTLGAGDLERRTADLSELAVRALTDRTPIDGGRRSTFVDLPAIERELRAAVIAESSCCSFLSMRLMRADGSLVLDVTGPAQAEPIIAELFATRFTRSRLPSPAPDSVPAGRRGRSMRVAPGA